MAMYHPPPLQYLVEKKDWVFVNTRTWKPSRRPSCGFKSPGGRERRRRALRRARRWRRRRRRRQRCGRKPSTWRLCRTLPRQKQRLERPKSGRRCRHMHIVDTLDRWGPSQQWPTKDCRRCRHKTLANKRGASAFHDRRSGGHYLVWVAVCGREQRWAAYSAVALTGVTWAKGQSYGVPRFSTEVGKRGASCQSWPPTVPSCVFVLCTVHDYTVRYTSTFVMEGVS